MISSDNNNMNTPDEEAQALVRPLDDDGGYGSFESNDKNIEQHLDESLKRRLIDGNRNDTNNLSDGESGPPPPDGGWGWVVVAASFFCLCVLDGISYTFGMFLSPLMEEMDCGRSGVSAAGSFQV